MVAAVSQPAEVPRAVAAVYSFQLRGSFTRRVRYGRGVLREVFCTRCSARGVLHEVFCTSEVSASGEMRWELRCAVMRPGAAYAILQVIANHLTGSML